MRILLLGVLLSSALSAQIGSRDSLDKGIGAAQTLSASELTGRIAQNNGGDRNSELFLRFAQLRKCSKKEPADVANIRRILAIADSFGDETSIRSVYSELASTLVGQENAAALGTLRDHAIERARDDTSFPQFEIFRSLGQAFRTLHDNINAHLAYEIAGQHLGGKPDTLLESYYSEYAAVLISVGSLDRALDCFQHARAIYLQNGRIPTQLLVDVAELELSLKHYDAAHDFIDQASQLSSPQDSLQTRFAVQETSARILIAQKKFPDALRSIHSAQALAAPANYKLQHFTYALYHEFYFQTHDYPALKANAQAMLASAQASGDVWAISYSKGLLGLALGLNGEVDKGIQLIDEAAHENQLRHATYLDNLEQKYRVYEAGRRYPEALAAYREYRDAEQQWRDRTNQQNLSHLEASLALERSEEQRRELLAEQQTERNREEQTKLQNLNLIHQEQLSAANAEKRRKDEQIAALHTQGQLIAAENMRQQLIQAQRNQQFQLEYLTRRSQLKSSLTMLLLACLLLAIALTLSFWRANLARKQQALEDPLTGLKNRRFLMPFMAHETERLRRSGLSALILLADIDLFKNVNDRMGHEAGDETLVQFADILRHCMRNSDVISRWGGEEFVIICPESNEADAATICARIRHQLQQVAIRVSGRDRFHLTISIGAAMFSPATRSESWENTLARADKALYTVKRSGRDHWQLAPLDSESPKPEPSTLGSK